MSWLTSLRDQLPLLFVLSPVIGFIVTLAASRFEPNFIRNLAMSNLVCTLAVLCGLEWHFESDLETRAAVITLAEQEASESGTGTPSLVEVRRTLDRLRTEQLRNQWFAVDGINLFPVLFFVLLTMTVVGTVDFAATDHRWFVPILLLFEAATLGVFMACDVQVFLFMSAASAATMSVLIGLSGSPTRRDHAERFLLAQFCGGALITLGFAMLVISIPWMKIQDATSIPEFSGNLPGIVQEIQKWTTRNELAFQYAREIFPWMLFVLSLGFAIQAGVFPFHGWQVRILSEATPVIAVLYLAGSCAACRIAWLRFVLPIAPDLLAAFDTWMLVPSFIGAVWGALSAFASVTSRRQAAFLFTSVSGIALLGCYAFTRIAMSGAWLMHQQIVIFMCGFLLAIDRSELESESRRLASFFRGGNTLPGKMLSTRSLILLIAVPIFGLITTGFLVVSELILQSLALVAGLFLIGLLIAATILSMLTRNHDREQTQQKSTVGHKRIRVPLIGIVVLAMVISMLPGLLLHQSVPEFARVFRRFEQSAPADSAETSATRRQESP